MSLEGLKRRELLLAGLAAGAATALASGRARGDDKKPASSLTVNDYLARAALLLDENRRAQDWIGYHPTDVGLASLGLELAELRSSAAAKISGPPTLKGAHMHMLLALENTTASFDATVRGDAKKAAQRMAAARAEAQTFNVALEALQLKVPVIK